MNTTKLSKTFALVLIATTFLSFLPQANADLDPALCGLGGAAAGAAVGSQFGGGDGKKAMIVLGAILGAAGGVQLCKPAQDQQDVTYARQNEQRVLEQGAPSDWSNPRYGRGNNSRSHIEKRGWYGDRECTMTRSVMHDRGGSYVNETVWCTQNGRWVQVSETTTIRQIQWGPRGPVGRPNAPMPPRQERIPNWIVSDNRVANFAREVERAFDSDRPNVARSYVRDFQRSQQFMTLDQLADVIRAARFDSTRLEILSILVRVVDQRYGSIETAVSAFSHSSSKADARRILLGADRRDDRQRDWRDDRRDEVSPRRHR